MNIERPTPLYKLNPMVNEDGLIQMEGQTEKVDFSPFDLRVPAILPDNHRITQLIFQHYHERSGHGYLDGYHQAMKNELRKLFYILHVDAVVRKVAGFLRAVQSASLSFGNPKDGGAASAAIDNEPTVVQLR